MKAVTIAVFMSLLFSYAMIVNALSKRKQFYPAVVYITKNNASIVVMSIQALTILLMAMRLFQKVFFGQLRTEEVDRLMERSWYSITETCLAFTVFRNDINISFVALLTILLIMKSFHYLAEERIDVMERSPVITVLFHVRMVALLFILCAIDGTLMKTAIQSTINRGPSSQIVFAFEYSILIVVVLSVAIKYILHRTEINRGMPWENKVLFLLYTDLIMSFIKVCLYLMFVLIMIRVYTLPLFAFRPMYHVINTFRKAFNDVVRSRRAIRNMNRLYPDATREDLQAFDNVCIICREDMCAESGCKKLPCEHIFHTACLKAWFQRQQTCPICRLNVLRPATSTTDQRRQPRQTQPQESSARPTADTQQSATPNWSFPSPPSPPPHLNGLPEDELKLLEAETREGLIARIRHLQNVHLHLQASVVLMQQYCAMFPPIQTDTGADTSSNGQPAPSANTTTPEHIPAQQ